MSSKFRHTHNPLVIKLSSTISNLSHAWGASVLLSADADTAKRPTVWTDPGEEWASSSMLTPTVLSFQGFWGDDDISNQRFT